MSENGKATDRQLAGEGRIAEQDDIAPEGTVVTKEHILEYRAGVEEAHRAAGLPVEDLWTAQDEAANKGY